MRLETTERLRRAIQGGEVVVHYQPQVSLRTGEVTGVEALARWNHPESGLVLPSGFLHQVESGGLMPMLTAVVLQQAIRQGAAWSAEGRQLTVAVNLSVTNLLDPQFPDQVVDLLAGSGLPHGTLELELTEDLFMADPVRARIAIARLLDAGVSLVVDDYGTGFSSLGYLRDLRDIRGLKLDRSFVTQHGRRSARRRDRGVDDQPRALPGHARRRRGRGDRDRAGPARRTRVRARAGIPVLVAPARRRVDLGATYAARPGPA